VWLDESYVPNKYVSNLVGTGPLKRDRLCTGASEKWAGRATFPRVPMGASSGAGIKCPACPMVIPVPMYGYHFHLDVAGVDGADESCHRLEVCPVIMCVRCESSSWVW
jgi:hypothetical protein